MPSSLRLALLWSGSGLAVFGVVFVMFRLREYSGDIDTSELGMSFWAAMTLLVGVYGAANLLLVSAWRGLLSQFGAHKSGRWALGVYGISQLAKYLPGNVFHIAGRQALTMADGVGAWPAAKSAIWELGLLALAGAIFGVLVLPAIFPTLAFALAAITFLAVALLAMYILNRYVGRPASSALGFYLVFLGISGSVFVVVVTLVSETSQSQVSTYVIVCGAYVVAWLIGLVTPGAPAGAGVRELVVITLLQGSVEPGGLVVATVMCRVITVLGDVLLFLSAALIRRTRSSHSSP